MPEAKAATPSMLSRVELGGADVARLLQLNAYKWSYQLPVTTGAKPRAVHLSMWVEEWTRTASKPQLTGLTNVGLFDPGSADAKRSLAIKLPRKGEHDLVINTESAAMAPQLPHGMDLSGPLSLSAAEREEIAFGRDLILVAAAQNASGTFSGDYKAPDFMRRNDRTVFVKARFTKQVKDGMSPPGSPVWRGGKIVFE